MTIKRFFLIFGVLVLFLFSCNLSIDTDWDFRPPNTPPRQFWALNARGQFYQLTADLLAEGRYSRVWVERGSGVTAEAAKIVAREFDLNIRPKMIKTFGFRGDFIVNNQIIAQDIDLMEMADVDGSGKITILFLDTRRHAPPGMSGIYIAGYFQPLNFFQNDPDHPIFRHSNETAMIYIDTNFAPPGSQLSNSVIAHEMAHLMVHAASYLTRVRGNVLHNLDLWINEGLATAAEWLYTGEHPESLLFIFRNDPSGQIQRGNNFFVWGNRTNLHPWAIMDDYATVYLFFQWLRLQSGCTEIFRKIISSNELDHRAVTRAANAAMPGEGFGSWENLLRTWLAANYINAPAGRFGYKSDPVLGTLMARTAPGETNISLYPGEGVFSITEAELPLPIEGGNIRYLALTNRAPWICNEESFAGGAMLSFNSNINTGGLREVATTTGISRIYPVPNSRFAEAASVGPFGISLNDMLRLNGREENHFNFDLGNLRMGINVNEQ